MKLTRTVQEVKDQVREWKKQGLSVGLVPTMGYLHEGHQSLIKRAVAENDRVVVSVFVNPIQFAPNEDLETYPRDLEADCTLCESTGAAMVFHPEPSEMYHDDFTTFVDMTGVTKELCGKSRPTHFRGVCTVVNKLFNIVTPDKAYFGQKDAQQLAVIRRMVRDLNMNVEVVGCPIIREADGLAKSSRNTLLTDEERAIAPTIYKALKDSLKYAKTHTVKETHDKVVNDINSVDGLDVEYFSIVDGNTLQDVQDWEDSPYVVGCITVYCGKTPIRLIDHIKYKES